MLIKWIFSEYWNITKTKHRFYCISQQVCYIRILNNAFVIIDYEMPADKALFVYAFTQNYTQTAIVRGDNK